MAPDFQKLLWRHCRSVPPPRTLGFSRAGREECWRGLVETCDGVPRQQDRRREKRRRLNWHTKPHSPPAVNLLPAERANKRKPRYSCAMTPAAQSPIISILLDEPAARPTSVPLGTPTRSSSWERETLSPRNPFFPCKVTVDVRGPLDRDLEADCH